MIQDQGNTNNSRSLADHFISQGLHRPSKWPNPRIIEDTVVLECGVIFQMIGGLCDKLAGFTKSSLTTHIPFSWQVWQVTCDQPNSFTTWLISPFTISPHQKLYTSNFLPSTSFLTTVTHAYWTSLWEPCYLLLSLMFCFLFVIIAPSGTMNDKMAGGSAFLWMLNSFCVAKYGCWNFVSFRMYGVFLCLIISTIIRGNTLFNIGH